jgi:hypothetical protein
MTSHIDIACIPSFSSAELKSFRSKVSAKARRSIDYELAMRVERAEEFAAFDAAWREKDEDNDEVDDA